MHTNRLSRESSPYLLQHQHNPVDWYSWGPEAFEAARRQDKPIFLSVGYSTCYWCHVMERQSFENEAVAAEMNRRFINIKVDREERPDVDQLYMTAVQVLARQGGWPMSVFLTPDLRPFYGGTYYPPTDNYGRPGFVTLLRAIEDAYRNRKDDVEKTANQLVDILRQLAEPKGSPAPITLDAAFIDTMIGRSVSDYDPDNGGFGGAPKFPRQTLLELLLAYLATPLPGAGEGGGDGASPFRAQIERMVYDTLDALARGGIRDQLGGGFHRYSTDAHWLVPHFEIMLYDNAMLAWCYVEAHRRTGERRHADVARGIFEFVLREMTSPVGAFYTAFDAEVDAMEGQSYLWTAEEIEALLGAEDARVFGRVYGVDRGPNFADPHHGSGQADKNILFFPESLEDVATSLGTNAAALEARLAPMRQTLYAARARRKQPLLDRKLLTSWNALMIRAFAYGGQVLHEPRYTAAASRAAEFLLRRHRTADGGLYRTSVLEGSGEEGARGRGGEGAKEDGGTGRRGDGGREDDAGTRGRGDAEIIESRSASTLSGAAGGPPSAAIDAETRRGDAGSTQSASSPLSTQHPSTRSGQGSALSPSPKYHGFLDDYAFLAQALLALGDATSDAAWTARAADVAGQMVRRFGDGRRGGFYFTEEGAEDLIVRQKLATDSPLPSGNAIAAMVLLELGRAEEARATLGAFAHVMDSQGEAMGSMVEAAMRCVARVGPFTVEPGLRSDDADRPLSPRETAEGVVAVRTEWRSETELVVRASVLSAFHLNAHEPGADDLPLIATTLSVPGRGDVRVEYPPGEEQAFSFTSKPLRVYSGEVEFLVVFPSVPGEGERIELALAYQPCTDAACLPPVTKRFQAGSLLGRRSKPRPDRARIPSEPGSGTASR